MAAKVFWAVGWLVFAARLVHAQNDAPQIPTAASSTLSIAQPSDDETLPPGAIARLGTTRFRPVSGAKAGRFLSDGRTVLTATRDGRLEYWDAESGRLLREKRLSKEAFHEAVITPDGRFVAGRGFYLNPDRSGLQLWVALYEVASGREVRRWDLNKSRQVDEEPLAISADGRTVAFDDRFEDKTGAEMVSIADAAKEELSNWQFPGVRSLALSPKGDTVAVGLPGVVSLWNWRDNTPSRSVAIAGDNAANRAWSGKLAFSLDGSRLAVDNQAGVAVLDVTSGKEIQQLSLDGLGWGSFSDDGRLLAASISRYRGGGVVVMSVDTGELLKRLETPFEGVSSLAFSADNRLLAGIHDYAPEMCVWDLKTGERLEMNLAGHWSPPSDLRFFPDEERLASCSIDSRIYLWKIGSTQAEHLLEHKPEGNDRRRWIRAIDVSPDGQYIASSGFDNTVRMWDTKTGREVYRLPGHGMLGGNRSLRFTPDGKRLASWGDDMRVNVFEVATGKALVEYELSPTGVKIPKDDSSTSLGDQVGLEEGDFSPDGSKLVVFLNAMYVFDTVTGRELLKRELEEGILRKVVVSPDNRFLLVLRTGFGEARQLADGTTRRETNYFAELRTLADGKLVAKLDREDDGWTSAAFSADGQMAAITVGGEKPRIVVVKIPEMTEIMRIDDLKYSPPAIAFSSSGKRLAVACRDTSILVYDLDKLPNRNEN